VGRSMADGYRPALLALCLLPALVVLAGLIVRHPPPVPPGRESVD
jgi:hypothetical protein